MPSEVKVNLQEGASRMVFNEVFQRFLQAATSMCHTSQALMENIFAPEKLDAVFHGAAEVQYERELLLFSTHWSR